MYALLLAWLVAFARVPVVYLDSAFLSSLAILSERGMNNLRVYSGLDGSIPPPLPTFIAFQRVAENLAPIQRVSSKTRLARESTARRCASPSTTLKNSGP